MRFGTYLGNQAHAPANSRVALLSAYAGGATLLSLAVRATADRKLVLVQADDLSGPTGAAGLVSGHTLAELRQLNFAAGFVPRGAAAGAYHYLDPAVDGRRLPVDTLADVLADLPRDVEWLIEVRGGGDIGSAVADLLASRGALTRTILAFETAAAAAAAKQAHPALRTALLALDGQVPVDGGADLLVLGTDGPLPPAAPGFAGGMVLVTLADPVDPALLAAAAAAPFVHAVLVRSSFDLASLRPSYRHVASRFQGDKVDRAHFALGYAKANRDATVYCADGVHLDIGPYGGPLPAHTGNPVEQRLSRAEWDIVDIGRTWPFYSGGGVGLTLGIADDFAAEVTYRVDRVAQATTLEMAIVNVDPGAHRAEPPASFRDKDSFYDPHGAPPYVGVEHDEDDGYRINWNLGTEYDNNQYGRPVGDGRTPRGARLRLERRGGYFAAYYRDAVDATGGALQPRDWVCVGVVRNDSLNRVVHVRCVGKRWRQERADDPHQYEPVIPNRFTFTDFSVVCFPEPGD